METSNLHPQPAGHSSTEQYRKDSGSNLNHAPLAGHPSTAKYRGEEQEKKEEKSE